MEDFRIRHYQVSIAATIASITLDEPVKISSTFIQRGTACNNMTGGLNSESPTFNNTNLFMDDLSFALVLTDRGDGFANVISVQRVITSISSVIRINFSTVEYIGTLGGPNEFINRKSILMTGDNVVSSSADISTYGILNKDDVIPLTSGFSTSGATNSSAGTGMDVASYAIRLISSAEIQVRFGGINFVGGLRALNVQLIEFTGSNWSCYHGYVNTSVNTAFIDMFLDSAGVSGSRMPSGIPDNNRLPIEASMQTSGSSVPNRNGFGLYRASDSGGGRVSVIKNGASTNIYSIHEIANLELDVLDSGSNIISLSNGQKHQTFDISILEVLNVQDATITGQCLTNESSSSDYPSGKKCVRFNSLTEIDFYSSYTGDAGSTAEFSYYVAKWPGFSTPKVATMTNVLESPTTEIMGETPTNALISNTLESPTTDIQADTDVIIGDIVNTLEFTTTILQNTVVSGPCDVNKLGPLDDSAINLSNDAC